MDGDTLMWAHDRVCARAFVAKEKKCLHEPDFIMISSVYQNLKITVIFYNKNTFFKNVRVP
jgi:hypothetical protein